VSTLDLIGAFALLVVLLAAWAAVSPGVVSAFRRRRDG
jgi:hypothetical protein